MVVRIRLRRSKGFVRHDIALAAGSLLMPIALVTFTMSLYSFESEWYQGKRVLSEAGLAGHWQMWLAASAVLSLVARLLGNYGSSKNAHA